MKMNDLQCECIFLTHNVQKHSYNAEHYPEAEKLLWTPNNQESKTSLYGGDNIRYQWQIKNQMIESFKNIYSEYFNLNNIRYIF